MDNPNEAQEQQPPYVIEGARSSRSRCKICRRAINKGVLRLGILIEGPYGTGYLWHHLNCAARRRFESVEEAYECEAWKEAKEPPDSVPDLDELRKIREDAAERKKNRKTIPYVEVAPSDRSKCKHCNRAIEKDALRVVIGRGVYFGSQVRTSPINVHPGCVAEALQAEDCITEAEGFVDALRANSQETAADRVDEAIAAIGELD